MRLLICNGSPGGRASVSELMADAIHAGFESGGGESAVLHLAEPRDMKRAIEGFATADAVLVVAPLFTESMPALVKAFIESVAESTSGEKSPALGFVIHVRYGESGAASELVRYYERLGARLGCRYLGCAVRGRSQALAGMTSEVALDVLEPLRRIGAQLARGEAFGEQEVKGLAEPVRLSARTAMLRRAWYYLPISQRQFDSQLRANGAFHRRFVRPYR